MWLIICVFIVRLALEPVWTFSESTSISSGLVRSRLNSTVVAHFSVTFEECNTFHCTNECIAEDIRVSPKDFCCIYWIPGTMTKSKSSWAGVPEWFTALCLLCVVKTVMGLSPSPAWTSTNTCRYICKYVDQKGSAAMLTSIQSAGVTPEVNLRIIQVRKHAKGPTLALKPRTDVTRSPKQWSLKKDSCPQKNFSLKKVQKYEKQCPSSNRHVFSVTSGKVSIFMKHIK